MGGLSSRERPLIFRLEMSKEDQDGNFGIELTEAGSGDERGLKISLDPNRTARVAQSLRAAIKDSGIRPGQLAARRRKPIELKESAGVRLALVMLGTKPVSSRRRLVEIEEGVMSMSAEETYYWYAKCTGTSSHLGQRALRNLLSGE